MQIFLLDTKKCMNALLLQHIFDSFMLIEGEITTFNTYHIDGRLKKEFYHQQSATEISIPEREFSLWKEQRELCFSIIKGKLTPVGFRFVLALSALNTAKLLEQEELDFTMDDIQGLYLNFKYDGLKLTCTTGTSMKLFTLDKSLENAWDAMAGRIFAKNEIPFENGI